MKLLFSEILKNIDQLVGKNIDYVSRRNKIQVVAVDRTEKKVLVRRADENIPISFERIELIVEELNKKKLVDINEALRSGGNDRSAIEALFASMPNVGYYGGHTEYNNSPNKKIAWFSDEIHELGELKDMSNVRYSSSKEIHGKSVDSETIRLPKSFILLAGISGTGKSRFVKEQAAASNCPDKNFHLTAVRPDWHEPSDLLGYTSNIDGRRYVVTDLLRFIINAWRNATFDYSGLAFKQTGEMSAFWLCLDEMNLAPVEQYFADFLSVIETRTWDDNVYKTEAIVKPGALKEVRDELELRKDLGLIHHDDEYLFEHFKANGISLPPNLIVAGTVNMDETTHGFSRKVIDRALTIDFGCFFPNDFDDYFEAKTRNKILSFPLHSCVRTEDLRIVAADPDGQKSIGFISAVNKVLKDTPFELAFRALNELLISLVCFKPETPGQLQAVWDDFLMTKVLPRIDGDTEKLRSKRGTINLLEDLSEVARQQLSDIWDSQRPDLLREKSDGTLLNIDCHSKKKMAWMSKRLADNGFTSFWP